MIVPERYANWLLHRVGTAVDPLKLPHFVADSLDHNVVGAEYTSTFNKRVFDCFVGFVDMKGFSTYASGKSPKEINDYIMPFLKGIIDILTSYGCLVDKTIGDEIMFILPAPEELVGHVAMFDLLQVFRLLSVFSKEHPTYKYRIGLSYGPHYLDQIVAKDYTEWVLSGESIIAAKRIMSVSGLRNPEPALCAVCTKEITDRQHEKTISGIVGSFAKYPIANWRPVSKMKKIRAKGLGMLSYQIMSLKNEIQKITSKIGDR